MSEVPPQSHQTHRVPGTHTSNFEESVVSEFQNNNRSHLVRNKSGKIVKNQSVDKYMPEIEEEKFKKGEQQPRIKINRQSEKQGKNSHFEGVMKEEPIIEIEKDESMQEISLGSRPVTAKNQEVVMIQVSEVESLKESDVHKIGFGMKNKQPERKFKITTSDHRKRSAISEPKNQSEGTVIIHGDTPLHP